MKYYIAYKFSGLDKKELKQKLNEISSKIESTGNETFIFSRDIQKWGEVGMSYSEIINQAFNEIDNQDAIFAFVDSEERSEGMLLEVGYAKAQNKKIILAIREGINSKFLEVLADQKIVFKDFDDLIEKIEL